MAYKDIHETSSTDQVELWQYLMHNYNETKYFSMFLEKYHLIDNTHPNFAFGCVKDMITEMKM
jgi:hypothetical protein